MARGGLSKDPEKARRQAEVLAEGRRIARERRAQGLPTKRTEEARKNGTGRVAPGRYRQPPPAPKPSAKPKPSSSAKPKPKPASSAEPPPKEPGRLVKAYARILGYA